MKAIDIVDNLLEAVDPDDSEAMLRTHPGFSFRSTTYQGEQVLLRGDSDVGTDSDWPWPIGHVIQGPDARWYAIDIHRIAQERLNDYRLGFGARTFATKEDAAMAVWQVWSQLPKREVLDKKRRNRVREAMSDREIKRYLSGVKARPGLKRYSNAQLRRFLARRQPLQPEPPGEPHRIMREACASGIERELIKASKGITHCGDYGTLYYHPGKCAVHWNMADSDGAPDYTSSDEIKKLLSLPGIQHVELGDEWSPDEDDGWKRLV